MAEHYEIPRPRMVGIFEAAEPDRATPFQVCVSAAGTEDYCKIDG